MTARRPRFFELTSAESRRVLARNHVGRLAFQRRGQMDIEPLGYVATKHWIYLRSAYGSKLAAVSRAPFVAFEVDEVRGPFDWRSVVVSGTIYMLPSDGSPLEQRGYRRAVRLFRAVMPEAFTPDDPVPEREHVYGLNVQRITGRGARSGASRPASARPQKRPARRR